MAKLLIPQTPDLEGRGSSLTSGIVSLDKELFSTLSLFCTHMYKMSTINILLGSNPGVTIILGMLHAKGNRDKLQPFGPLAHLYLYFFLL